VTTFSHRYVVLSLDALGDLTLRQPMLSGLLDSGAEVCVVTRSYCAELVPIIDKRLTHIETVINPYRYSPIDTLTAELQNLLLAIQEWVQPRSFARCSTELSSMNGCCGAFPELNASVFPRQQPAIGVGNTFSCACTGSPSSAWRDIHRLRVG